MVDSFLQGGTDMEFSTARRGELLSLLGELPSRAEPVQSRTVAVESHDTYVLEKLLLDLNGIETVPAYFVRPAHSVGELPIVVYSHAHGGDYVLGKDELLVGRNQLQNPPYAKILTDRGLGAIAIDHWGFGERRGRTETAIFKEMLWKGRVMWGMMVFDSLRVVDYLAAREDVDINRIGALGLSMGSTMSWWLAALDPRIKVCVDICCLTDYQALIDTASLDEHSIYYYVPGLLKHFTAGEINALIAPRPHLSLAGIYDPLTPNQGLERINEELKRVYHEYGKPEAWKLSRYATGHFETAAMRREILSFLEEWL